VFNKLVVNISTSTGHHPQIDGQSERTNQTSDIALRFHLTANPGGDRTAVPLFLQTESNKVKQLSTGFAPTELGYGFRVNDTVSRLADLPPEDYSCLRPFEREEAESTMAFANAFKKKPLRQRPPST